MATVGTSGALITFFDGSEMELGADTTVVVVSVGRSGNRAEIRLENVLGSTVSKVVPFTDPGSSYRIESGGTVALVRGTVLGHRSDPAGNVTVALVQANNVVSFPTESDIMRVGEVCTLTTTLDRICESIGRRNVWDALADGDGVTGGDGTHNSGLNRSEQRKRPAPNDSEGSRNQPTPTASPSPTAPPS